MRFVAGARFSEPAAGTNAIGTALAEDHAVQVFAAEHFCDHSQLWTCAAAPIHDPATGALLGTIDLTSRMETVHPHNLAVVMTTAAMVEAMLGGPRAPAATRRLDRRGARIIIDALGRDRAEIQVDGHSPLLSLRHSEILVLLAANPSGLTADQLALALYGDAGKPVTARAEISRLRRVLGAGLKAEPYRLDADVRGDLLTVRELLRAGRTREALERYRGPLLPRSDAPGVVDLRHELDGWARRAALAGEDVEALWSWVGTPSGADDLQAWKRFIAHVPPDDGRRFLAAARLERLRELWAAPSRLALAA